MANTIKLRRSAVQGNTPTTAQLALGEIAINTYDGKLFLKKDDGSESIVEVGAGGSSVTTSDSAPSSPADGDLWYDTTSGALYVYYNDGSSSQWVTTFTGGSETAGGGADNLNELTDVSITGAATGEVLRYNGSAWVDTQLAYSDLSGTPSLATVATSGSYNDLADTPTLGTAAYFSKAFSGSQSVGSAIGTFADIGFNQTPVTSGTGDFTHSTGSITVVQAGVYSVSYNAFGNQTSGNNRKEIRGRIELNGTAVVGTTTSGYSRNDTQDGTSVSGSAILSLSASDVLTIGVAGDSSVTFSITEAMINIQKIS